MHLEQRLAVRLSQRLIMTPSLQQAIKLLQMSKLELLEEVAQEIVENPALEEGQRQRRPSEVPGDEDAAPRESASTSEVEVAPEKAPFEEIDYESFFQDLEGGYVPRAPIEHRDELPSYENILTRQQTLSEHLIWQLDMARVSPLTAEIGRAIIGNLDEDGFLRATVEELSQMGDYPEAEVAAGPQGRARVRPRRRRGHGAAGMPAPPARSSRHGGDARLVHRPRSLGEARGEEVQGARRRLLGCSMPELGEHLEIIKHLDPRPGQKYNTESSRYVIPDVYVVKLDNEYKVLLNEEGLPRLHVSSFYRRMAGGAVDNGSVGRRRRTGRRRRSGPRSGSSRASRSGSARSTRSPRASSVTRRISSTTASSACAPSILKDVAEDIQMHESTVSRVVNNKYMHTHRGLFEMKYFFHSGISSAYGDDVSSRSVKEKIRKIIGEEDGKRPLSDSEIARMLKQEGLQIARRTVAKYREELRIPSSNSRRQIFT